MLLVGTDRGVSRQEARYLATTQRMHDNQWPGNNETIG